MPESKIALFGGTFDPIHLGHTEVADVAARRLEVDEVVFIPARRSPLKGFGPRASDDDRLAMIALATQDNKRFRVSDCELRRNPPSYTIDTVRQFRDEVGPETTIYWLLGADSVAELAHWHRVDDLLDACHVAVMYRGGYERPSFDCYLPRWGDKRIEKLQKDVIETPSIDISSTEIRRRLAQGDDVSDMLHPQVATYIAEHNLYERTR